MKYSIKGKGKRPKSNAGQELDKRLVKNRSIIAGSLGKIL